MAFFTYSIMISLLLGLVTFALCFYLFFSSTFNYWKDRGIPFIKPVLFFGNLKDQFLGRKHLLEVQQEIYDGLKGYRYGGFFEMKKPSIVIRDPALVQQIIIKDFTYFYDRGLSSDQVNDPFSANLFNMEGESWKYLRNKLTPTFTTGKLKGMFEQIYNCGDELNGLIEEQSKTGRALEIKELMSIFALDVIASCAFGLQMDKHDEMTRAFRKAVHEFFNPSKIEALRMALLTVLPKIARKLGCRQVPKRTEKVIMKIIRATIKFRENGKINRNDFLQLILNLQKQDQTRKVHIETDTDHDDDDDIIDQMKYTSENQSETPRKENNKVVFSDTIVAAQAFTFLIAGAESVSLPISLALYHLTKNPILQEKAHTVIDTVLEKHNYKWSYQAVREMTYIDQILQETFRISPIGTALMRICTHTYKIPDSNDIIEKGTRVLIPVHAIHNDPQNHKSPEVFDPDRFVNNNFKPSGIFLPFGDGPRICIAMRFAILEMKVALAKVLSEYTVRLSSQTKEPLEYIVTSVIPLPKGGLWFEFEKRKKEDLYN